MSKRIALLSLGILVAGCARTPTPAPAPQAQTKQELPVICRLVGREQTLTISAGPRGSVYSVQDAQGKMLLSDANRDELRVQFPVLSHQLDSAIVAIGEVGAK